jgi:hypothetical protein
MQHTLFGRSRGIIEISKPTSSHRNTSQWILRKEWRQSDRSEISLVKPVWHASFITKSSRLDR